MLSILIVDFFLVSPFYSIHIYSDLGEVLALVRLT